MKFAIVPFLFFPALSLGSAGDFLNSPSVPEGSPWEVTGAVGIGLASGNSDTATYSLQVFANYEKNKTEGEIGASYLYSDANGVATTNNFRLDGRYSRTVSDRLKVGAFTTFLTDDIANLDYRFEIGLGPGYNFIKTDRTKLTVEVGPGYIWEEQDREADDYFSLRLVQRFERKINPRSKIWQSLILSSEAGDFDNLFATFETGIDVVLADQWGLRTSFRYQLNNSPPAGNDKEDLLLLTGLTYTLGGTTTLEEDDDSGRRSLMLGAEKDKVSSMGWDTTAAFNLSLASGNADNLQLGLSIKGAYRQYDYETFMEGIYTYSQNDSETSADSLRTKIQHNRKLSERVFLGGVLGYFHDDLANVAYRLTPTVTAGYYLHDSNDLTLSLEVGPGYLFEEVGGGSDSFFTLNFAEKLTWKINNFLTFKQSLGAIANPSEESDYILTANASLETKVTKSFTWQVAFAWTRDNTPANEREKDDTTLTSGFSVRF